MKLFVANIAFKLEEAELKQLFVQFGQVASVKLVSDPVTGKRKGFGFIEMPVREQAQSAIAALHDKELYGRKLAVTEAVERERPATQPPDNRGKRPRNNPPDQEIDGNRW